MQDTETRRPPAFEPTRPEARTAPTAAPTRPSAAHRHGKQGHGKHAWLALGLTGLLGAVWAMAIASRYPNILPG